MKVIKREGTYLLLDNTGEILESYDTKSEAYKALRKLNPPCLEALDKFRSWTCLADKENKR